MTMKANGLEKEFERMDGLFDALKVSAEERSARAVYSKGPYFDFPFFSYQRKRMQRGRLIKSIERIRNYNDVYFYMFDSSEKIIREGWDGPPDGSSYNTFYKYNESGALSMSYTYGDLSQPANVTLYEFSSGKLLMLMLYGLYGVREERYFYDDDFLKEIDVSMRGHGSEKIEKVSEWFDYYSSGLLRSIEVKYKTGDSEVIYEDSKTR